MTCTKNDRSDHDRIHLWAIHSFRVEHNMRLVYPPKFCLTTIVFDFSSWDDWIPRRNFKEWLQLYVNFLCVCVCDGGGRGTGLGEKSECHIKGTAIYGLYGNVPL